MVLWTPLVLLVVFQFYMSGRPVLVDLPGFFPQADKVAHAGYFFLMAVCAIRAGRSGEGWSRIRTATTVLVGALIWALSDELHQGFTPGRAVEVADIVADVVGAAIASLVLIRKGKVAGGQGVEPR